MSLVLYTLYAILFRSNEYQKWHWKTEAIYVVNCPAALAITHTLHIVYLCGFHFELYFKYFASIFVLSVPFSCSLSHCYYTYDIFSLSLSPTHVSAPLLAISLSREREREFVDSFSLARLIVKVICYGIVVIGFYYGSSLNTKCVQHTNTHTGTPFTNAYAGIFFRSTYLSAYSQKRYPIHIISNNFFLQHMSKTAICSCISIGSSIK